MTWCRVKGETVLTDNFTHVHFWTRGSLTHYLKKWHAVVGPVKIGILCPHFFSREMLKFWHAVLGPYSKVPMVTKWQGWVLSLLPSHW